jgi:hypothetical protein
MPIEDKESVDSEKQKYWSMEKSCSEDRWKVLIAKSLRNVKCAYESRLIRRKTPLANALFQLKIHFPFHKPLLRSTVLLPPRHIKIKVWPKGNKTVQLKPRSLSTSF